MALFLAKLFHKNGEPQTLEQETVKYLKFHRTPQPPPYKGQNVRARNQQTFLTHDVRERQMENVHRRQQNLSRGFFSQSTESYKPIGDVITDAKTLALNTLRPDWRAGDSSNLLLHDHMDSKVQKEKEPNKDIIKTESGRNLTLPELRHSTRVHEGGLQPILKQVNKVSQRVIAVRGGWPYQEFIEECEKQSKLDVEKMKHKGPVMRQLSQTDTAGERGIVGSQHEDDDNFWDDSSATGQVKREKKLQSFRQKLEAIRILLVSLHNMRLKDLRTKKPLSLDTVMALRFQRKERDTLALHSQQGTGHSRRSRILESSMACQSSRRRNRSSSKSRTKRLEFDTPESTNLVETWEDLLAIGGTAPPRKTRAQSMFGAKAKKLFQAMAFLTYEQRKALQQHPAADLQPLWQTIPYQIKTLSAHRQTSAAAHSQEGVDRTPDEALDDIKQNLLMVKYEQNKLVTEKVNKLEARKLLTFYRKFAAFSTGRQIGLLYDRHRDTLEDIAYRIYYEDVQQEKTVKIKAQEWFTKLSNYCQKRFPDDLEVNRLLSQLSVFSREDMKSLPHMKEFACLLSQSLPVLEMCTSPVQQAFRFVLREVLVTYEELFDQWLKRRNLPNAVYP